MRHEDPCDEMIHYYGILYRWHKENGASTYEQRFGRDWGSELPARFTEYLGILEKMPPPEEVCASDALELAEQQLMGCLEWSFSCQDESGLTLGETARRLRSVLRRQTGKQQASERDQILGGLRNIGDDDLVQPCIVEISVSPDEVGLETYCKFAQMAYADILAQAEVDSVGGYIVLADTNLEREHWHNRGKESSRTIRFRNAKALHLVQDETENSIVRLARSGDIVILDVRIGG